MVSDLSRAVSILAGLLIVVCMCVGVASASERTVGSEGIAQADSSDIEITSIQVPDTVETGEEYTASATVQNTIDRETQVRFEYVFAGEPILFETMLLPAGGQQTEELTVTLGDVTEGYPDALTDGTYEHGIRAGDAQETRTVAVQGLETTAAVEKSDVEFVDSTVPDVMMVDRTTQVRARISYTGTERTTMDLVFRVNGVPNFNKEFAMDPGETETISMNIDSSFLGTDNGDLVEGGVYEWTLTAQPKGGDEFRILTETGGEFGYGVDPSEVEDVSTDGSGQTRGFFSNSGDGSGALGDAFNLTILGFLLSVAGILHQMLGGR